MDDRLALFQAQSLQHRIHPLGAEDPHQIVFERDKEFGGPGVTLAPGSAAQLVVDAPALMALAADDEEAAAVMILDFDHMPTGTGLDRGCRIGADWQLECDVSEAA